MTIAVTARIEVDPAHLAAFMEAAGPAIRAAASTPLPAISSRKT